jgi:hypothetical protein
MLTLNDDNYYSFEADRQYMSVSQYKRWMSCEKAAYAQYVTGEYQPDKTTALLVGGYFHSLFDGTAEDYLDQNPECTTKKGDKRAEIKQADLMFQRCRKDRLFTFFCDGQREEIYTTELFGMSWKCKVDVVNFDVGFVTDIKTVRDFDYTWSDELKRKAPFYQVYGYDLQMAVYQEIIAKETGYRLEPYIAAVTKQEPPDIEVINFINQASKDQLWHSLFSMELGTDRIKELLNGEDEPKACGRCDYCRSVKVLDKTQPARWAK